MAEAGQQWRCWRGWWSAVVMAAIEGAAARAGCCCGGVAGMGGGSGGAARIAAIEVVVIGGCRDGGVRVVRVEVVTSGRQRGPRGWQQLGTTPAVGWVARLEYGGRRERYGGEVAFEETTRPPVLQPTRVSDRQKKIPPTQLWQRRRQGACAQVVRVFVLASVSSYLCGKEVAEVAERR
ncbi:hypothetical protein EDB86DRAFT_2828815 [Lactarius hatsudake]|nr:hypothetical protein EDB86DRAFT_2828815 [Lactarius hatsudake]